MHDYLDLLGRPLLKIGHKALFVLLLGWAPLPALVILQLLARKDPSMLTFFSDFGVHARSLLAAPLLVLAEAICLPRLAVVAEHFVTGGLVRDPNRARFDAAVSSTKALANSNIVTIVAVVLAYAVIIGLVHYLPPGVYPLWHSPNHQGYPHLSWASWWYAMVSLPLLLVLILTWCWRIACWIRFLFLVSRLKLFLIPAHPDRVGGLGFLDLTLFAFMPLALTLGVLFAGPIANQVFHEHLPLAKLRFPLLVMVGIALIVFVLPLVWFSAILRSEFRRGVLQYGGLAHELGREFEKKWFNQEVGPEALEVPDFSATTDLYSIVAYSEEMRTLPFDLKAVVNLVVVTLLPFVPVAFMTIPLSVIVDEAAKLLF
ncbi:MAG TPA: hypothetical protein VKD91_17370 [Pyrinomonadaceae bacterium]|nr:hypothetical protein [Pyrinomonadaceae bacterium]